MACVGERETGEQVIGDRAWVLQVTQLGDQHEVFPAGEHVVDGGELSGEADRFPHLTGRLENIEAVHTRNTGVSFQQGRQDADYGRLARTVRAEQREDFPFLYVEVDAPKNLLVLERLYDAAHPDRGLRGHFCSSRSASSTALFRRVRSLSIHCLPA